MTARLVLAVVLGVAACSGGDGGATGTTTTTTVAGGLPAGVEELAATDTAVATARATFEAGLSSTAPGSQVTGVAAAYRGPQRAFSDAGCPGLARTGDVVVVVYFEGTFTSPSGAPSGAALVNQSAAAPEVTGTLFVDAAPPDPLAWCRSGGNG